MTSYQQCSSVISEQVYRILSGAFRSELMVPLSKSNFVVAIAVCMSVLPAISVSAQGQSNSAGGHNSRSLASAAMEGEQTFLTSPSTLDPLAVCQNYLMGNRSRKGFEQEDLEDIVVANRHQTKRSGVTHLYMKQRLGGIDIEGASYVAAVDVNGRLVSEGDKLKRAIGSRAVARKPSITAKQAVSFAALALGISSAPNITMITSSERGMRAARFSAKAVSRDEIPAKLNYIETDNGELRLSWNLVIRTPDGKDWWNIFVDADTGAILKQVNWMTRESYNVFPVPNESPAVADRSVVTGVPDPVASPYGWHDTNMAVGAEFTDTRGNNVFAQEDVEGDDGDGIRPDGGAALEFSPSFNPLLQPASNQEAATLNLFYWNNILHDVLYLYGFDEASGNFQRNNYARGGIGNDLVQADSQDGTDLNNAVFGTPPDGTEPRMEMFLWTPASPTRVEILSPASVAGDYSASTGAFGAWTLGSSGNIVLALDEANITGPTTTDGCTPFTNALAIAGNIALVDRGECLFVEKTANAQAAGAIAIIIVNNQGDDLVNMSGQDLSLTIPPLFIGQSDGATLKAELANGLVANVQVGETRDVSFDSGIIAHEYAHGLSNRLTGGAADANCLAQDQSRGMGEGWSDWLALTITATAGDRAIIPRSIGTYASSEPVTGPGIRNHPYTRDMGISPLTLANISSLNQPHGVGEVWASALWDLYWNLVNAYGFDPNLYSGTGGNNVLMTLVIEGLKLQDCNPTFLQARDAIITADLIENAGTNQCLIWEAFARRGMGESASVSAAFNVTATEAFDQPSMCSMQCGNEVVDVGEQCDDGNNFSFDGCAANCRTESELVSFTGNADGGQISLVIDGVALNLSTTAGQSANDVALAVADAINSNTALQSIADIAVVEQGKVVITGNVEQIAVNDAGFIDSQTIQQVPIAWQWRLLLFSLLIVIGMTSVRYAGITRSPRNGKNNG